MRKLLAVVAMTVALALGVSPALAQAQDEGPHQVLVCKYVGTPGVNETLQTGQNPIVVDTHALEDGFVGVFPFEFEDAQGRSVAIRYLAEGESAGDVFDISECPAAETPSPTPTPTPTPTETPTPPPVTETPPPPAPCVAHPGKPGCQPPPNTAFTGANVGAAALLGGILLIIGLGALWYSRKLRL